MLDMIDPSGAKIKLARETWEKHVLDPLTGHPEPRGYEKCVKWTVESPGLIVQSSRVPTAKVYLKLGVVPIQPRLYLKVPVNFYDDKYGEVSTVMLTRSEDLFQGSTGIGGIIYGRLK